MSDPPKKVLVDGKDVLQNRLIRSERMAAVGKLAGGVAHEINNPLAYIIANVNFLREELAGANRGRASTWSDEEHFDVLSAIEDIEQGATKIRNIIRDLSAFSRFGEDTTHPIDVREVLDATARVLANEFKHRATLSREYSPVPTTWANKARLGQVFFNLFRNALQAIPIGTAASNFITVRVHPDSPSGTSERICVEIEDTGTGIEPCDIGRIFDPFFSTHSEGEGTGLGLTICQSIITTLGGDMTVRSRPGCTTISVFLDCVTQQPRPEPTTVSPESAASTQPPRILVVDDEPPVVRALKRLLRGYTVTSCVNGREALQTLEHDNFDLIFCDLMMPEMTGMEFFRALGEKRPELHGRFVFMTGGAFTPAAEKFLEEIAVPRIDKPFSATELRHLVTTLLSQSFKSA